MTDQRHVVAMDPPHITEFASERYFEKLNQLNAQKQQPSQQTAESAPSNLFINPSQSKFILPLREAKTAELEPTKQKQSKSRFFSIRQKVASLHSKHPAPADVEPTPIRASTDSGRKAASLDQLFLTLPNELQIQIVSSLSLPDILNLRLTCKAWHSLVTHNESTIVRSQLETQIPPYALRLYPIGTPADATLHNLCGLWHRLHVATKLSVLMSRWVTKDIFLRTTELQRLAFSAQEERMRRRLIPLLFTLFHFFETYRKHYLEYLGEHDGRGLKHEPFTTNPIETRIMNMYDDQTLLRVHEVFPLVISSFCRRLRPPTYVGRVERSLRGYIREKPSDDMHVAILLLGGLRQVERLWEIKGYNARRGAVDTWYNSLTKSSQSEPAAKPRRGLMHFGRRKSSSGERSPARTSVSEGERGVRSPQGSVDATNMGYDPYWIFNTSLSAGEPMAQLDRDDSQKLLDDLPVLQHIWCVTAEAMIMDRGIVTRPQSIKRNQQLMLDLIREDGVNEEDEWWYGRSNADSVRPPTAAIDDDAD